ncbi:MAG: hypothetical protein H0V88_11150 [Pyrinomonadaceae bacterium]|nr:hypothetical protein [Pyrinomonadaceae bacterium]
MITGFNTDVAHGGTVYHVQTEDKGINTPLILSLVYVGGAILASKRTPYDDLLESNFNESELAERLQRQHKLICAAIRAGRIEDLKRLAASDSPEPPTPETFSLNADDILGIFDGADPLKLVTDETELDLTEIEPETLTLNLKAREDHQRPASTRQKADEVLSSTAPAIPVSSASPATPAASYVVRDGVADFARGEAPPNALHLALLGAEEDFHAGEEVTLRIYVGRGEGGSEPVPDASIAIKILGTTFRPRIVSAKTDAQGVAVVKETLPVFTNGRAAIVIKATDSDYEAELRRIIQQA